MTSSKLDTQVGRPLLPYAQHWIDEDDIQAVVEALRGWRITQGPAVRAFEEQVARWCGARYAVAVSSGTAALHCAAFAAGLGPGDEAIVPTLTFVASANCVAYLGATPMLADSDPATLTCDPGEVARRLSPRTKALIAVDFGGHPADLDALRTIATDHRLVLIEDATHSLGASYHGRRVGTLADMTVFSFHPAKQMTTGEGGMIVMDDPQLYERLLLFRNHGITHDPARWEQADPGEWYYEMHALGLNYRITDVQCALGARQLTKLDRFVQRRREIARRYDEAFAELSDVLTVPIERPGVQSAYHLYTLQFVLERLRWSRAELFSALRAQGLGVQVHYIPVHLQPYYRRRYHYPPGEFPHAERYYERCVTIPLYPRMSDEDVDHVIRAVRDVVRSARA